MGMGKGHRHRWNVNKIARGMDEWSNPKAQISKPVQFIWGCSPANSKNEETPSAPTCTSTGSHNVKEKCDKAKGDKSKPNAIFLRLAGQTKRPPLRATRPRSGRKGYKKRIKATLTEIVISLYYIRVRTCYIECDLPGWLIKKTTAC